MKTCRKIGLEFSKDLSHTQGKKVVIQKEKSRVFKEIWWMFTQQAKKLIISSLAVLQIEFFKLQKASKLHEKQRFFTWKMSGSSNF